MEAFFDIRCAHRRLGHSRLALAAHAPRAWLESWHADPGVPATALLARTVLGVREHHPGVTVVALPDGSPQACALRAVGFRLCPQASGEMAWEHRPYDDSAALKAAWHAIDGDLDLHIGTVTA